MTVGAKSSVYEFSRGQTVILDSYLPKLEAAVGRLNPTYKPWKDSPQLTKWRNDIVAEIMDLSEFRGLGGDGERSRKQWEGAVAKKYSNYFTNTLCARHRRRIQSSQGSSTSAERKSADRTATNVFRTLAFAGNLKGRQLFKDEMESEIQAKMDELGKEMPHLHGGALLNKALASLWDAADQDHWEDRAKEMAQDVYQNQHDFPFLMAEALQGLSDRGVVGPSVMRLDYGFRDQHDGLVCGSVYAGVEGVGPATEDDRNIDWESYVEDMLPRKPSLQIIQLPHNSEGLPLFPQVNERKTPLDQLVEILEQYLLALWVFAQPERAKCDLDWAALEESPNDFYNVKVFEPPVSLKAPHVLKHGAVFELVDYFVTASKSANPFRLRLRSRDATSPPPPHPLPVVGSIPPPPPPPHPLPVVGSTSPLMPPMSAPQHASAALGSEHGNCPVAMAPLLTPAKAVDPSSTTTTTTTASTTALKSTAESFTTPATSPATPAVSESTAARQTHADAQVPPPNRLQAPLERQTSVISPTLPQVDASDGRSKPPSPMMEEQPQQTQRKKSRRGLKGRKSKTSTRNDVPVLQDIQTTKQPVDDGEPVSIQQTAPTDPGAERRVSNRKRKAPEPIKALTNPGEKPAKRARPGWIEGKFLCDEDGHPLNENGERVKW